MIVDAKFCSMRNRSEELKLDKPLVFIQCLKVLELCVKHGLIMQDTNPDNNTERNDNILIYYEAGTEYTEGWYSENIHTVAQKLMCNQDNQQFLIDELQKRSIPLDDIFDVLNLLDELEFLQNVLGGQST